jgi:iron complex outermembrane receptor protein
LALAGPTAANPNANQPTTGKDQPRVPKWRASGTIAYRPIEKLNTSISGRYSSQQSSQLNNTDINKSTYSSGGNAYFIVDLHANYNITKQLTIASGIDNVTDRQVWLFHPFPARTYFAEIKYQY